MLFSTFFIRHQHQWNWGYWVKGISWQHPPLPKIKTTQEAFSECILCIYLFNNPPLKTISMFLQPMLWQEKLWEQERDSVRPSDHRQVGLWSSVCVCVCVNRWKVKWMTECHAVWTCWATKWRHTDELVNKLVPSRCTGGPVGLTRLLEPAERELWVILCERLRGGFPRYLCT